MTKISVTFFIVVIISTTAWGGEYIYNGNDTVTSVATGLTWQRRDDDSIKTWEDAITYCETLNLDSYKDWRLPNVKELHSIVSLVTHTPAIDPIAFPGTSVNPSFWTSTTQHDTPDYKWDINFEGGSLGSTLKTGGNYVRCVRGGQ